MKGFFRSRITAAAFAVLAGAICAALPAFADVNEKDYRTITRAIGFLQKAPQGNVDFAIVYDPRSTASVAEAQKLQAIVRKNPKAGGTTLVPRLVPVGDAVSAPFVFVTSGLPSARVGGKPVIFSLNRTCVETGACTVYVNTEKRVEILINKKSAVEAEAEFKQVFMVMVSTI